MMGWRVAWKWAVACRFGESSQHPTWPQVRHNRKWTHSEPIFRQSSQPSALGVTSRAAQDKPVDISGIWAFQIDLGGGTTGTPTVTFKQDGEKLTGTYSSQVIGEHQFTGTIKGNEVKFGFDADFGGNAVKVAYSGTVSESGDSMKGTASFGDAGGGTFTATKKK